MKRETIETMLKDVVVDEAKRKEIVDGIMKENGNDIEKHKKDLEKSQEKVKNLETELEANKKILEDANTQIQQFKEMDIEGIKKSADEWKSKSETFQTEAENQRKDFEKQMQIKEYQHAASDFVNGHKFTSEFAKNAFLKEFLSKELKLEDGKFLGADDYVKQFKEANPGVLVDEAQNESNNNQQQQSFYQYQPKGGNGNNADLAAQIDAAINGSI